MFGATLSRWTLSYFAASLLFLLMGTGLMAWGFGYPFAEIRAAETLIVVHVVAIGWLVLLMCGALLQFVPVLITKPLRGSSAALPALLLLLAGLVGLLCGFAGLAGLVPAPLWLLPLSAFLLIAGFVIIALMLGMTTWSARPLALPARFVSIGLACLIGAAALGGLFTLGFSGMAEEAAWLEIAASGVSVHAALGLGGWMSFTAMGVSYRLLTMFMLSPDTQKPTTHLVWWTGVAAFLLLVVALVFVAFGHGQMELWLLIALLPGVASIGLYTHDVHRIYRQRKRKAIELNSKASIPAFAALFLSLLLAILMPWTGATDAMVSAFVYLVAFGWLTGLGLAQLYKIVPFLTWLECYGPVMGRMQTPHVQDFVDEVRARRWFVVYYCGVTFATLALLANYPAAFRLASAVNLVAIMALIVQFIRARRLMDVPDGARLPDAVSVPYLIYAATPAPRRSK
ncbi:hypothetical protein KUG47_09140 [Falsochrobactrum sp. TDYN1]|uniref:Uncharacterized protein n=1 Tax=Falsochrobactrum tianjinense TaxID=2706015 RepID=A0A949PM81_9HYPH|nr:hypothetical protein [Falsochrobactrum sp. TDYN1]MBV2143663.1 hypothetical protein [Falsochrobactrum sp. TDYN1]